MPGARELVASLVASALQAGVCLNEDALAQDRDGPQRVRQVLVCLESSWRKLDTAEATLVGVCRQRCSEQMRYAEESVGCGGGRVVRERELEHQGWAVVDLRSRRFPVQASSGEAATTSIVGDMQYAGWVPVVVEVGVGVGVGVSAGRSK